MSNPDVETTPLVNGQAHAYNQTERTMAESGAGPITLEGGRLGQVMTYGGNHILPAKQHNGSKWEEQS